MAKGMGRVGSRFNRESPKRFAKYLGKSKLVKETSNGTRRAYIKWPCGHRDNPAAGKKQKG